MRTKLLISTAMVATAFCVNAAQAENLPASMSNDRYVYPNIIGGTYTMKNAVLESGNDAEGAEPVDMLIQNASITATDSDIESTGKLKIDGSTISVTSTKITNEQLKPWIRYGKEDKEVMEKLYGIHARDDIDIVDSQISLTRSYINANSELKDGNLTISDTENDDKPTSLILDNSRIDTGAIKVEGGEINIKDSAMHGMYDIAVSGGVANIDNGELTVDVGSPVDDVYTQGKLTISGGEINLKNGGSIGVEIPDESVGSQGTVEMIGGKINVVDKGDVVTKEFDMIGGELNVAKGATFDVIKDAYLDESDKVVISEYSDIVMGDDATINLEGNLNTSGISGTGTLNFNEADAKVVYKNKPIGELIGVNVNINADNTFIDDVDPGMVGVSSLTINQGTVNFVDYGVSTGNLDIKGGVVNLKDKTYGADFDAEDLQISNGTVNIGEAGTASHSGLYAENFEITGGTVNLAGDIAGGVASYDIEDSKISYDGKVVLSGGELNSTSNVARIAAGLDVSGEGVLNVKDGTTLKIYQEAQDYEDGEYEAGTAGFETYEKGILNLTNGGVANINGTLIADVDGNDTGALNFNAANAVVDGDVKNVNVTFNADNTLSKAITGEVSGQSILNIVDGTIALDNDVARFNSLNISGGTTNVNDDFYVSTLQNPNGGDITIEGGTVNLNGYSLNAMSGGINVSGGTINMVNQEVEDPDNTLWAAKDITIKGGVINMGDDSSIDTFYDWENMDKPEQAGNIYIQGGQINVTGQSAGISSEGKIEVSDKGIIDIADGATLNSYSSFSVEDDEMEEKDKATIDLKNNGTINVSGKLAAHVSGDSKGTLNFNSVNAVVDGDVENVNVTFNADNTLSKALTGGISDLAALNIAKGTLVFDKKVSVGSLNVDSVLDAGLNKVEIDGDANFAKTSTLKVEIAEDDNGSFKANNINVEDGAKLAFNITKKMEIGDEIKDVALLDGNLNGVFKNQLPNSRYTITSEDNKVFNITYDASASDVVIDAGGSTNNAATAEAWDSMVNQESASDQAKAVASVLVDLSQNATTPEGKKAYVDALTALAPETAPAVQQVATETANQIFGAVGTRLSGGSIASTKQGMSSGDNPFTKVAVWVQGLFNKSKLDKTKKAKGFDSKTYGTAMGIEGKLSEEVKLGVGYAYSKTDIDGFKRDTDVKTHTAIAYGEYKPNNWFVNGIVTYGWSDYDEKKNVGGMSVKADYDVEALSMQAMTGYDMNINGFGLTPETGLRYVHIKNKSYKNSVDERVKSSDSDIITGVVGARLNKAYAYNHMILRPELKAAMTYDLANDDTKSVVTLVNGSSYAVSGKALNRFGVELGVGLTMEVNDNVELSLGYEAKFREDYQDHTGLINAKYKF